MTDNVLSFTKDVFDGVTVKSTVSFEKDFENTVPNTELATKWLETSIEFWKNQHYNGVWFEVDLKHIYWVPILAQHGFTFHRARDELCVMIRWLPEDKPNTLPLYPFTSVGVGGVVVNKKGEVLLMREKRGSYLGWKFPGGLADPGERISEAVKREVLEETGIKAEFKNVITFRHITQSLYEKSCDLYFLCYMTPVNEDDITIVKCERETADAKWVSREDILKLSESGEIHHFHMIILDRLDKLLQSGRNGCYQEQFSFKAGSSTRQWDMYFVD
ncbi:unnamed protein product [Bursaphelenchus okinawaensis]|uniref:Nudix hydrolase domain-containing protein n=1 Tax=Bursaphelenchus okinawaensis TaxID=465554 RepID=A0A811LH64_9BILA|nr:unnamed protein product [Bursaphelenchus okinawaensis]CAG9123348.1 unnamed protein product [Bursaphelenchus okinawaensis]